MCGGVDEDVSKNDGVRLCCLTRSYEEQKERNVRKCIQELDGHKAKSFLPELKQITIFLIFIAE